MQFNYGGAKVTSVGGFDWNLQFSWHPINEDPRQMGESDTNPVRYDYMTKHDRRGQNRIGHRAGEDRTEVNGTKTCKNRTNMIESDKKVQYRTGYDMN